MKRLAALAFVILGLFLACDLLAADWPQYRYDAGRSAASPEQLPATLHLQWTRQLPTPRPAFPAEVRLAYDASYEPVVLGKTLLVPSMVTDSVTAVDTESGAPRWHFLAEGPVRFAPVASRGKVYFVSDDGCLYCVDAADGKLRWKFEWLPPDESNRKVLGSGRLISLRPARGGPVLADGVLFFGAGIWSKYGVSVHALDAESGKVIWSNTQSDQVPKANMDHGIANYAGLTPQGYLAVVNDKLVVPCGAQLPAFLDLNTGALDTYCMGWGGRNGLPKGTWFVAGARNYLSHGGDLYDVTRPNDERFDKSGGWPSGRAPDFKSRLYPAGLTRLRIDPVNQKDLGAFREPVFTSDVMFDNDWGIVAYDLGSAELGERAKSEVPLYRKNDTYPDKWKATFRELWRLPSELRVHIKAGDHLYLGGEGVVQAVRIPAAGEKPQLVWETKIEGTPHRMLAADGKLFVVTREGKIYAFGPQEQRSPAVHAMPRAASPPADGWTKTATQILHATKVRDGFAVVLGANSGRLVEELIGQSSLDLIVIEPDAQKAAELRERLHRAGLYGIRASVHVGDPLSYPLPPYLASLVVSEDWAGLGAAATPALLKAIFHPLRPYGGTACLAVPPAEQDELAKTVAECRLAGAAARRAGDWVLVSRDGPLCGSADWTHAEADAANTGASEDRFVAAPLELLWFDTPKRWMRTLGATMVRVCGGRMFIKAGDLRAFDVFTGRTLWQVSLPFAHSPNDQVIALEDAVYVAGGTTCLVLDPATGRESGRINVPDGLTGAWSDLRAWQDYLVGRCGKHLVCIERSSGKLAWKYDCGQPGLSVAVGGGKVFSADLPNKKRGETNGQAPKTRAFDIATGELLWEIPGGSEVRYAPSLDLVVTSAGIYRAKDGSLAAPVPKAPPAESKPGSPPKERPRPLFVVGQKLLFGTTERIAAYDLETGDESGEPTTWTRRGCTIPRASVNLVTTRFRGNAACIDLASREIIPFWNVRAACSNNLFPADGVLNMPSLTGGCTCNYMPVSQAYVPASAIERQ